MFSSATCSTNTAAQWYRATCTAGRCRLRTSPACSNKASCPNRNTPPRRTACIPNSLFSKRKDPQVSPLSPGGPSFLRKSAAVPCIHQDILPSKGIPLSSNPLVHHDGHNHPPVLCLPLAAAVTSDLVRYAHRRRRQNARQRHLTGLLNGRDHGLGTLRAQPLVQVRRAHLRRVSLNLNHRSRRIRSRLHKVRDLLLVLRCHGRPTVRKRDHQAVLGVELIQLPDPAIRLPDCGFVGRRILRVLRNRLLVRVDVLPRRRNVLRILI